MDSTSSAVDGELRGGLLEFATAVSKHLRACAFGVYLLTLIVATNYLYPSGWPIARYDFLFLAAVLFQITLLALRLETRREASAIIVFHVVATCLEVFVTSDLIRAWQYPGDAVLAIGGVPLFAGFMYSSVGSYIARMWRIFDFQFSYYPPLWAALALVSAVYVNFFTHHFTRDVALVLIALAIALFHRSTVTFRVRSERRRIPLLVVWLFIATLVWIAENICTYSGIWVYPKQVEEWQMVSPTKLTAWFLLLMLSFVLVSLVHRPRIVARPDSSSGGASVLVRVPGP